MGVTMRASPSRQGATWSKYRCKCAAIDKVQCVCNPGVREEMDDGIQSSVFKFCDGKCGLTYAKCLKTRGIKRGEHKKSLSKQEARNLNGLFSRTSSDRLVIQHRAFVGGYNEGRYA